MNKEQSCEQLCNSFDGERKFSLSQFIEREQRNVTRLTMAAWGVGGTHEWFRTMPRDLQVRKVQQWVQEALDHASERRTGPCMASTNRI